MIHALCMLFSDMFYNQISCVRTLYKEVILTENYENITEAQNFYELRLFNVLFSVGILIQSQYLSLKN